MGKKTRLRVSHVIRSRARMAGSALGEPTARNQKHQRAHDHQGRAKGRTGNRHVGRVGSGLALGLGHGTRGSAPAGAARESVASFAGQVGSGSQAANPHGPRAAVPCCWRRASRGRGAPLVEAPGVGRRLPRSRGGGGGPLAGWRTILAAFPPFRSTIRPRARGSRWAAAPRRRRARTGPPRWWEGALPRGEGRAPGTGRWRSRRGWAMAWQKAGPQAAPQPSRPTKPTHIGPPRRGSPCASAGGRAVPLAFKLSICRAAAKSLTDETISISRVRGIP